VKDPEKRRKFLADLFREGGGTIRFDRWMHEALYHPEFGYYTSSVRDIGTRGDFTTWPVLEDSLAEGVSRWLQERKPKGQPWNVIEIGAGTGALAHAVLKRLGRWSGPHFHIVDVSPVLREQQKRRLRWRKVSWHSEMKTALHAAGGHALIFANELVDAFPCRVFRREVEGWSELFVGIQQSRLVELWQPTGTLPDSSAFEQDWKPGQRLEVQESVGGWLQDWRPFWRDGEMLIIDYGAAMPEVFQRRPQGTLRAYAHHQRLEGSDVLGGFGHRDITCDVNFSDVCRFASRAGMTHRPVADLGAFLTDVNSSNTPLFEEGGAASQFCAVQLLPPKPSVDP